MAPAAGWWWWGWWSAGLGVAVYDFLDHRSFVAVSVFLAAPAAGGALGELAPDAAVGAAGRAVRHLARPVLHLSFGLWPPL